MSSPSEKMVQVGFRFPAALVSRLDAQIARGKEQNPGRGLTRADLVRQFVLEGLARMQGKPKRG